MPECGDAVRSGRLRMLPVLLGVLLGLPGVLGSRQVLLLSMLFGDAVGVSGSVVKFGGLLMVIVMRSAVVTSRHILFHESHSAWTWRGRAMQRFRQAGLLKCLCVPAVVHEYCLRGRPVRSFMCTGQSKDFLVNQRGSKKCARIDGRASQDQGWSRSFGIAEEMVHRARRFVMAHRVHRTSLAISPKRLS